MGLKDGLITGIIAGTLWGMLSMVVNGITGVFPFEQTVGYNLIVFATGGAVFGVVVGALLSVGWRAIPFRSVLAKALAVSLFVWTVLRVGGLVLSHMNPYRYHAVFVEAVQGLVLAAMLGIVMAMVIRLRHSRMAV